MPVADYGAECPCCGEPNPAAYGEGENWRLNCCGALIRGDLAHCTDGREIKI